MTNPLKTCLLLACVLSLAVLSCTGEGSKDPGMEARVVDVETGGPVSGAFVLYHKEWSLNSWLYEFLGQGGFSRASAAKTDEEGRFTVPARRVGGSVLHSPFVLRLHVYKPGYYYKLLNISVDKPDEEGNADESGEKGSARLTAVPDTVHLYKLDEDSTPCGQWQDLKYEMPFHYIMNNIIERQGEGYQVAREAVKALKGLEGRMESHQCYKRQNVGSLDDDDLAEFLEKDPGAVDESGKWGKTQLYYAARSGALERARILIENGADVNVMTSNGTPLHIAAQNGHARMVKLLLENGADPNAKDKSGGTPLHTPAWIGHEDVVAVLIEGGADPNLTTSGIKATPLHFCAQRGWTNICKLLLENGAEPSLYLEDKEGKTPLDLALENGKQETAEVIKSHLDQ